VSLLQETDTPDHVEDRGGDEVKPGDGAAQERLRVAKDGAQRGGGIADGALAAGRRVGLRKEEEESGGEREPGAA
jgi:hypothetical protein